MKMRMQSGRLVDPLNLKHGDVCIEDIAHGLSHINRFNGQTPWPYSVALHSTRVALRLEDRAWRRYALLHDAAEAYLGDVIRPIKGRVALRSDPYSPVEDFVQVEMRVLNVIIQELGLPLVPFQDAMWRAIFEADDVELRREQWWFFPECRKDLPPDHIEPKPVVPDLSRQAFLTMWEQLN